MKAGKVFLIGLCCVVLCLAGYQRDLAAAKDNDKPLRIAVVNIRELFAGCKKNADYQAQATRQRNEIYAELEKLTNEIEATMAALKTRKVGVGDYWDLRKDLALKQSSLEAKKELYQQQLAQKDQQWTQQLYKEILECTARAAKQKGIDIVLAKDQMDLPVTSGTELMLTIRTHKLLYAADDLDITKEVLVLLDARSTN